MMNPTPLAFMPENLSDLDIKTTYITACGFCGLPVLLMPCTNKQGDRRHHPVNLTPMGFISQQDDKLHGGYQSHVHTCPSAEMADMIEKGDTTDAEAPRTL